MKVKDELNILFGEGKSISECIEMGYKQATVYRYHKIYKLEVEKEQLKVLVDESERIKKVFNAFADGKKLIDVVREHGIAPAQVRELYGDYVELGEIEGGMKENLDIINEILDRKRILEAENTVLEANLAKIKALWATLPDKCSNWSLEKYLPIRSEHVEMFLDTRFEFSDYSDLEREQAMFNKIRAALCGMGVRF